MKKEKIFHPNSRKAGQLARSALRAAKLQTLSSRRAQKQSSRVDFYGFFFHALPPNVPALSLPDLHALVRDVWLTRNDQELQLESAARKKGRPKSAKETRLEDIKAVEVETYRTGMEVPDLTHPVNVALFREWDQTDVQYVQQLRHVRISSQQPGESVVSQAGKHLLLALDSTRQPPPPGVARA